jgi:hypothetical protein
MDETWLPVIGYEGYYEVSNYSRIKSLSRVVVRGKDKLNLKEKILSSNKNTSGYYQVGLSRDSKTKSFQIHRLCAISFIPNDLNIKNEVNHIDGNINNNHISNLEWVSRIENNCHQASSKSTTSNYVGVYWHKLSKKWMSRVKINNKTIYLGTFNSEKVAYEKRCNYFLENNIDNKYL